ncbi:MAG: hypothetical protein AAGI30_09730 [Planctomycetota bacterium]
MPDEPGGGDAGDRRVLLIMIISSPNALDDVLTAMLDYGVAGTVVEAKGLMALMREEMPVFGGLASMLGSTTGSKVILSLTTAKLVEQIFGFIDSEMKAKERPLAFTVPVDSVRAAS